MHVRERMIRRRFATHPCERCGSSYGQGTVLVLARRPAAWLVLASCGHCEHRCIYLVSFRDTDHASALPSGASDDLPLTVRRAYTVADQPTRGSTGDVAITQDEVAAMRRFLDGVNGDFHHLFGADGHRFA